MGRWTLRAALGMSLLVGISWDTSAVAAPWSSTSSSSNGSSLDAILHNAGLEVPPTQSLKVPEPAHNALDLFSMGAWLGAPLALATQPLASFPSQVNRRLRPQAQVELPGIDRAPQWLAALPGLGLMSSTAQLQRQQPQQEKELAAAASRLANSVKTVRLSLTPTQCKALETMVYALQTIRIESNRSVLSDYDRAVINQLTATASKSVEEVERFLNSYSELLTRLSALGGALQSLSPPWEYTPSAPLAVAAAELHVAAQDAAAAISPDQEQQQHTSSSSSSSSTTTSTTTTTRTMHTSSPANEVAAGRSTMTGAADGAADGAEKEHAAATAGAAAAGDSQETSLATPPPQHVVRSTAAARGGGRQRNRRASNVDDSSSSSSSTTTTTTTTTAVPDDVDEQEEEDHLDDQQLQEQQLIKEVQQQLQEQQLQEQQLQQLQLQLQLQHQLQEQQQMQMQLQEQLQEQQQLQEMQQLQQQYEEGENWRKVQQQRLQMHASEEAAAMARLRALLRSNTYSDLRAAMGPYGPPVSLREAMAFKEFGDKLKVKGWGANEIRRAAKKTSSTTEAFHAVAREVGLSKASVDTLSPRMPTLLK
ncbi:hypothetical protein ACSSS7_006887 [Eimeria intestinalis]